MKKLNPLWKNSSVGVAIDTGTERCVSWLLDPKIWSNYKGEGCEYAVGAPSLEMFVRSYNIWKDNNETSGSLCCTVSTETGRYTGTGYKVGVNNSYLNYGLSTANNTIASGPAGIFGNLIKNGLWLASPTYRDLVFCAGYNNLACFKEVGLSANYGCAAIAAMNTY